MNESAISRLVRLGFMAGRGSDVPVIARSVAMKDAQVRQAIRLAGVDHQPTGGQCVRVTLNIEQALLEIDAVGRAFRLNRDEVAAEILRTLFDEGEEAMRKVLNRSPRLG